MVRTTLGLYSFFIFRFVLVISMMAEFTAVSFITCIGHMCSWTSMHDGSKSGSILNLR